MEKSIPMTDQAWLYWTRAAIGAEVAGITYCALGEGNANFVDPQDPPTPSAAQKSLKGEFIRKPYVWRGFVAPDAQGDIVAGGTRWRKSANPSAAVAIVFQFSPLEVGNHTIREYGFFAGEIKLRGNSKAASARNGIFHRKRNKTGQVSKPGFLMQVANIPDYTITNGLPLELICLVKAI